MNKPSNYWAMESIIVMKGSSIDQGASQGKSNLVNVSSRSSRATRWTSIVKTEVGQRVVKNHLSCTSNKRDLNIISMKRQSIDRANHKLFDSTKEDNYSRQTFQ